jgi:membrane protease YdiL (CAAX protease family)
LAPQDSSETPSSGNPLSRLERLLLRWESAGFASFSSAETPLASVSSLGASDRVSGWVTLITGFAISGYLLWKNRQAMDFSEYNLLNIAFILWVPLITVMLFLRREPSAFGMTVGDVKGGTRAALLLFLAFVPVILIFAPFPGPQSYYLSWLGTSGGSGAIVGLYMERGGWSPGGVILWERLIFHEAVMGFYMFGWEWYHRGFLLTGLRRIMPVWGAILTQAILFTVLHIGKPWEEVASSFPGAILMGLVALRYRSFLPCFLLHWLVSAGFDAAVLFYHFRR